MDHETRAVNIPPSPKTPGLRSRGRVRRSETLMHARFIRGRWKYGRVIPHVRSPIVSRLIALSRYTELHSRVALQTAVKEHRVPWPFRFLPFRRWGRDFFLFEFLGSMTKKDSSWYACSISFEKFTRIIHEENDCGRLSMRKEFFTFFIRDN